MDAASLVRKMVARLHQLPSRMRFAAMPLGRLGRLPAFFEPSFIGLPERRRRNDSQRSPNPAWKVISGLHYPAWIFPFKPERDVSAIHFESKKMLEQKRSRCCPPAKKWRILSFLAGGLTRKIPSAYRIFAQHRYNIISVRFVFYRREAWGLIACHQPNAKLTTFVQRTEAELFSQIRTMTLERSA